MTATDLAIRLANAFGDADAIAALLAEDARWHLPISAREHLNIDARGRAAIDANMRIAFGGVYEPGSVAVAVEDAFGDADRAVVRLRLTATVSAEASGGLRPSYENEYVLVVHTRDGMISEVWELVDVAWAHAQFRGETAG